MRFTAITFALGLFGLVNGARAVPTDITPPTVTISSQASPATVWRGEENELVVHGAGLSRVEWAELRAAGQVVRSTAMSLRGDTEATFYFPVQPVVPEGSLELFVGRGESVLERIGGIAIGVTPTYKWGAVVDGKAVLAEDARVEQTVRRLNPSAVDCPQPAIPKFDNFLPSIRNQHCEGIPTEFISQAQIGYFLLKVNGDTIRTSCPIQVTISTPPNFGGHCH